MSSRPLGSPLPFSSPSCWPATRTGRPERECARPEYCTLSSSDEDADDAGAMSVHRECTHGSASLSAGRVERGGSLDDQEVERRRHGARAGARDSLGSLGIVLRVQIVQTTTQQAETAPRRAGGERDEDTLLFHDTNETRSDRHACRAALRRFNVLARGVKGYAETLEGPGEGGLASESLRSTRQKCVEGS